MSVVDERKAGSSVSPVVIGDAEDGVVRSVARAAHLLAAVAEYPNGATVKQMAYACGLALPTAYHLVNTLVAQDLLVKGGSRQFRLGPQISVLARARASQQGA